MLFSYTVRVCSCTAQYVHALSCVHSCALVFVHFITRTLYTWQVHTPAQFDDDTQIKKSIPSSHYKAWAATITQRGSSIINTSITLHHIIQSFPIHSAEYSLMASTQSSKDSMSRWPSLLSCTVHSVLWLHGSEIGVCKLFAKSLAIEVCL